MLAQVCGELCSCQHPAFRVCFHDCELQLGMLHVWCNTWSKESALLGDCLPFCRTDYCNIRRIAVLSWESRSQPGTLDNDAYGFPWALNFIARRAYRYVYRGGPLAGDLHAMGVLCCGGGEMLCSIFQVGVWPAIVLGPLRHT